MPQERNIKQYFKPLGDHGLLILLIVLVAAVGSTAVAIPASWLLPYQAEAVALFKSNGGDRAVLTSGKDPSSFQQNQIDVSRQAKNVQVLMSSLDIAQKVKESASADPDAEIKTFASEDPLDLRNKITVESRGDLLYVRATAPSASAATWLANTWTTEGIARVNTVYATSSSDLAAATTQAQAGLDKDEKALQTLMGDNSLSTLTQELSQTQKFLSSAADTQAGSASVFYDAERTAAATALSIAHTSVYNLQQQSAEAQALRTRVEQSPDTQDALYANQVTLILLLNKLAVGNTTSSAPQVQLNLTDLGKTPLSKADQLRDVDATAAAIQKLQDGLNVRIQDLENKLSDPLPAGTPGAFNTAPPAVQAQIDRESQLQSEIEQKTFALSQLQQTRNLDQDAYNLLSSRLAEQQLNTAVSRVIDSAEAADYTTTLRSHSLNHTLLVFVGTGVLTALAFAIGLAYLLNLLRPNFNSTAALRRRIRRARPGTAQAGSRG